MKIISLRFKNINALKGEWKIDFSQEPFVSSGLFAITGPTGAGKTTLLDAICLALYHRTPRLNEPSPADKVMTRHAGECLSEVEFEVKQDGQNKRYRAFWEVRRARGAAEGKLQPAKVELAEVNTLDDGEGKEGEAKGGEEGKGDKIIAEKVKDKDAAIAQLTGLDFGRFTKSMLLAQGGFAAFLNANAGERADLLEELTGTEIYGKISVAVFERFKEEESQLTTLREKSKNVDVLDIEALQELEHARTQSEACIHAQTQQANALKHTLVVVEQLERADTQQQLAKTDTQNALQCIEQSKPDLDRLANSAPANKLRPLFNTYNQEAATLTTLQSNADKLAGDLLQAQREQKTLQPLQLEHQQKVTALDNENATTNALITDTVIPLDQEIKQNEIRVNELGQELERAEAKYTLRQQQSDALMMELKTTIDNKEAIQTYLIENTSHQQLQVNLPLWKAKLIDRKKLKEKIIKIEALQVNSKNKGIQLERDFAEQEQLVEAERTALKNCKKSAHETEQALHSELNGETLETVNIAYQKHLNLQGTLLECANLFDGYKKQAGELQKQSAKLQQKQEAQINLVAVVELLRKDYLQQKKLIVEIKNTVKLENDIASLQDYREKLQADEECPLCGATDHPAIERYQSTNSSQSQTRLHIEELALASLQEQGESAKAELVANQTKVQHLEEAVAATEQSIGEYVHAWRGPAKTLAWNNELTDADAQTVIPALIQGVKENKQLVELRKHSLEQLEQQWHVACKALTEQEHKLQRHCNHSQLLLEKKGSFKKQITDYLEQLEATNADLVALEGELEQQLLVNKQWALPNLAEQESWLQHRQIESDAYQQNSAQLETTEKKRIQQEHELATLQQQAVDARSEIDETQIKQHSHAENLKELKSQRHAVFADKDATIERQRLSRLLMEAEESCEAVNEKLAAANKAELTLQVQLSDIAQAKKEQKIKADTTHSQWLQALEASPFLDEATFSAALLEDQQEQTLAELKQSLDTELVRCKALQQQAEKEWQTVKEAADQIPALKEECEIGGHVPKGFTVQVTEQLQESEAAIAESNKRLGEIEQMLKVDLDKREQQKTIIEEISKQEQQYDDWDSLKSLIGSADGKRFRVFAQGLTLDHLIHLANGQLEQLHNRYQLERKTGEALELEVIDTWQADAVRDTKTLSGGESFLVSLALALALSDLVSHKTKIDSLFLDEGFGTLDRETLDIALDALDNLNASGKMIGVISHVEALKERIPVQIEIKKMSGLGVSQLDNQYKVKHLAG